MSSFCLAEPLLLDHASFASIHQDVTVRIADRIGVWFLNKSHVMRWAEARFMEAQDRGALGRDRNPFRRGRRGGWNPGDRSWNGGIVFRFVRFPAVAVDCEVRSSDS